MESDRDAAIKYRGNVEKIIQNNYFNKIFTKSGQSFSPSEKDSRWAWYKRKTGLDEKLDNECFKKYGHKGR